ncbi:hypothetical protein EDEG_00735 [Edhazardia aedis USNM 41457]|uniref:Uncharacterized protein n=1 Tax=Edhazardia aedis (strain USNM 41457) TaxID=1003232 RepID=J9DV59_EDHAE|nr:hypothetical protein EDEG_00735 [Edhazardia aedis USNM 41457]|eukprot:EJW05177.1 hypothetical protein EDEG_00735 [Edhazardia aedis USNM 41457]
MYSYKNLTKSTNNMKKVKIIQNSDETTDLLKKENKNSLIITNVTQYVNDKISNDRYSNKKYYNINNNANDSEKHSQDNKKLVYEKEKQIFVAKNTKKIISKNKNREHEIIYGASIKKADKNIKINSTNIKTNQNKQSSIIYGNIYTNKQINSKNNVQLNESGIIYGRKYDGIHVNTSPSRIRKNEIDNYDIIYGSRNKKSKKYILERSFEEKATKVADIINSKKVTENHDYSYLTDSTRDQSDRFCNKFKKNAKNKKIKPVKKKRNRQK